MSIQPTNSNSIVGAPGEVEPGDYEYALIGASYWSWPHATFVPGTSTIDYVIGADNYVVGGPLPGLFVAVGSSGPVSLPGEFSRGSLNIEGFEDNPVVVDVRAFEGWEELSDLGAGAAAALFMVAVAGLVFMALGTIFSFITLPVEYDASNRALAWLKNKNMVSQEELAGSTDALKWAARTYLVAALGSLAMLLYWGLQVLGGRD